MDETLDKLVVCLRGFLFCSVRFCFLEAGSHSAAMLAQELTTVLLAHLLGSRITGASHRTHLRYVAQGPGDNSTYLPLVFPEFPTPSLR